MTEDFTQIAEQAVDLLHEELENDIPQEFVGNMDYLYNSAKIFLNNINDVWTRIQNINHAEKLKHQIKTLIKANKETEASVVQEELAQYHQAVVSKEEFADFMDQVFNFQEIVNNVLGQKVQMVYLYRDRKGNPTLYMIDNSGEHIKQSLASKGRGMSARYGSLSQSFLDKHGKKIMNSLKDNGKEQLDMAYKETIRRGEYSKKKLQIGFLLVLWQPMRIWLKMEISSLGDINEAYAAFYLNMIFNNFIFSHSSDIEWLLNCFLIHDQFGVAAVDTISGFFEGDVSIGNVEYGIKSKGASTLGSNQVIEIAQGIISEASSGKLTLDYVKELKKAAHDKGHRRNIVKALDASINGTFEDIIGSWGVNTYGARPPKK